MKEDQGAHVVHEELLRCRRVIPLAWITISFFIVLVGAGSLSDPRGLIFIPVLAWGLVMLGYACKQLLFKVAVQLRADGLHVGTGVLSRPLQRLFTWDEVESYEVLDRPRYGGLGDVSRTERWTGWQWGIWAAKTFSSGYWMTGAVYGQFWFSKGIFGEREIVFTSQAGKRFTMHTNQPDRFVTALDTLVDVNRDTLPD